MRKRGSEEERKGGRGQGRKKRGRGDERPGEGEERRREGDGTKDKVRRDEEPRGEARKRVDSRKKE